MIGSVRVTQLRESGENILSVTTYDMCDTRPYGHAS